MKRKIKYYRLIWLKHDLPAGLAVFLVALPLCLGIALASGAPLYAGLLSGIVGGLLVSLISGSHLGVSGPAAGLTTVVAAAIDSLGDYHLFLLTVVIAGLFQVLLGLLKLGSFAYYFPSSVIKGMLASIGIILIAKQVPLALGYDQPDFWTSGFAGLLSANNFLGNLETFNQHITRGAMLVTVVSLLIMYVFKLPLAKRLTLLPAPLFVVLAGAFLCYFMDASSYSLKPTQLVSVPNDVFSGIIFPDFSKFFSSLEIWKYGLIIGLLATLETLLCVEAVDKLDRHNRITPANRELLAQGIGNMACGILGGLPITAVVVRGAANVDAGGRTRLSAFTHGVFLLLAVLIFPVLINKIPYAALASVLIVTGYNLTRPKLFISLWKQGVTQFLPFIITVIVVLSTDLLIGVSIGLLISVYFIVSNNFRAEYRITKTIQHETEVYEIRLNTNVTFLNKVNLRKALDQIPEYSILTIDGENSNFIDYDILEIISEFGNKARDKHIELHLKGIKTVSVSDIH